MRKTKDGILRQLIALLNNAIRQHRNNDNKVDFGRRNFLKQSAKGAMGATIALTIPSFITACADGNRGANTQKNSKQSAQQILDIAILGGGIAGLNCANHLLNSNLSFKVFEGSKRLGGRILTHYNDAMQLGIFPEFGGDFIDSDHQDMLALAKELGLETIDLIKEQEDNHWVKDIYYFDNRKIAEKEIINAFKKIAPQIAKDKDSLGENYDTPAAKTLDNTPLATYIHSLKCTPWLQQLLTAAFVAEYGLDCEEQSTLNLLDLIETNTSEGFKVFGTSDERYRIKGGNSKIIEGLADKIGRDKIALLHAVTEITEGDEGIYTIKFEAADTVQAKAIVCTIPFTILRTISLQLKNMPPEKKKCIDELGYGSNTKLVLGYDGQPWRSKENNAMGYLFTNDMTNGWDGSVNKTENNPNGAYVVYFGGNYSKQLCDESSKNPMAPPTHVWRTELPKERVQEFVTRLDKVFKGSQKKFLDKHVFVNWIEYPWVKASYSCYKPGQWTTLAGWEGTPVGNFYFAGEHCSEEFQGFMNGAAETGRTVAQTILNAHTSHQPQ